MNGYREEVSDVEFQWCDFVPPPLERPTLGFEMSMQWQEGPAEAPMDIREINVLQADTLLGQCIMLRERANPEWCHCDHLRVEPAYQGQRLGQYLVAVGLREMQQLGCRHALVGTEFDNARAILCYTNLGFRFTHRLATFRKQLA
jgi:ribosomal protein S18 acetylase RimI-like enzyme